MKSVGCGTYASGGGRTLNANDSTRCLAASGSASTVDSGTKLTLARGVIELGEAEWAAAQTGHFKKSI